MVYKKGTLLTWCLDRADIVINIIKINHIYEAKNYIKFKASLEYKNDKYSSLETKNYKMSYSRFKELKVYERKA